MTFLDVEGLHDEDMLVYDDGEEEGEPRDGEEDMMPEGADEDVVVLIEDAPTPGQGWANYHAADGCNCGTFEEKPCGACNKDAGRRYLCPVCHCHMHVPIEGLCEPADGIRGKSRSEDDSGDYAVFCPKHTPGRAGGQDQAPKRRRKDPPGGAGDLGQSEGPNACYRGPGSVLSCAAYGSVQMPKYDAISRYIHQYFNEYLLIDLSISNINI